MTSHKRGKSKRKLKGASAAASAAAAPSAAADRSKKKKSRRDDGGAAKGPPPEASGVGPSSDEEEDVGERLTLEALDAISDESDDGEGGEVAMGGDDDDDDEEEGEWSAEAAALRRAIAEGAFNGLVSAKGGGGGKENEKNSGTRGADDADGKEEEEEEEEEVQEVALEDDSSSDEAGDGGRERDDDPSSDDGGDERAGGPKRSPSVGDRALRLAASELESARAGLPWAETFDVVPATPLPFGRGDDDGGVEAVDINDDLKREVAFYNLALEAVHTAKVKCGEAGVPFSRPDDFFAEMVKTDDHMAKVKDRLIFETKKMDAFEQRKANREHKLRAREARAHRAAEKAKAKKDHLRAVDEWAREAASGRTGAVRDDDDAYLDRLGGGGGPGKKRRAADRKFGFGGKRGRFKQTTNAGLDDYSGYNARAGGTGPIKRGKAKGGGGAGANRKGKRARDAARARR